MDELIKRLNAKTKEERLEALCELKQLADEKRFDFPENDGNVNNHIHTTFSFSPYSPAKAIYMARMSKLSVAGIIDHDSVGGITEFREAGRILGLPTTAGFELRVGFEDTPLKGRRINNPDQNDVAYMAIHGLAGSKLAAAESFLRPIGAARAGRNRKMCARLTEITGIKLDYDTDVLPLSEKRYGGSVTERHLLCALSLKLIGIYGKDRELRDKLLTYPGFTPETVGKLTDPDDTLFLYDLIGILKSGFIDFVYLPAGKDECPRVQELVRFAKDTDSILAYAYLGDVTDSVTGDKKAQTFEDSWIEELFEVLNELGIKAITYMPARNTREQLERVRNMCERYDILQISGEDINSPRQPFVSKASKDPYFANLKETTWKLIEHENKEETK